jgi:hypothetical protein
MTAAETSETEAVARRYFDAGITRDIARAATALADDLRFTAGDMTIEGRDAFLDSGAFPTTPTRGWWPRSTKARSRSRCTMRPGESNGANCRAAFDTRRVDQDLHVRDRHGSVHGIDGQ